MKYEVIKSKSENFCLIFVNLSLNFVCHSMKQDKIFNVLFLLA